MYLLWRSPWYWIIRPKLPAIAAVIVACLVCFGVGSKLVEKSFEHNIIIFSEARAKQKVVQIVHEVIKDKIVNQAEYNELMQVHKDNQGRPVMIQPNIIKIDKLQSEATSAINQQLINLKRSEFRLPFGQLTGNKILAALGPELTVRIVPVSTVKTEIISSFDEAGINQTRHRLSLRTEVEVQVIIPYAENKNTIITDVLIADNILIGPVPETILNFDGLNIK